MEEQNQNQQVPNPPEDQPQEEVAPAEAQGSTEQPQPSPEASKDARTWAMFCHLSGLAGYLFPVVGNIVAPLIMWQMKKDEHSFVDDQGKEAVNFQISVSIYSIVSALLIFLCVGAFLLPAVIVFDIVLLIIAAIKANNGISFRYPLTIRLIK